MPCPTCDHAMQNVAMSRGTRVYWCPRCGTLRTTGGFQADRDEAPKLVGSCRYLRDIMDTPSPGGNYEAVLKLLWHKTGIAESINLPADRPTT